MRSCETKSRRGFRRIVFVLNVLLLCVLLTTIAGTAIATEVQDTNPNADVQLNTEAAVEETTAATVPTIPAEDVEAAWNSFCELMPEALKVEKGTIIGDITKAIEDAKRDKEVNPAYVSEAFYNTLDTYVKAAAARKTLDEQAVKLQEKIGKTDLEHPETCLESLTKQLEALPVDPMTELIEAFSMIEIQPLETKAADSYYSAVIALDTAVANCDEILDLYQKAWKELHKLQDYVEKQDKSSSAAALFSEMVIRWYEQEDKLETYFQLTPEEQPALLLAYEQLRQEIEVFPLLAALTNSSTVKKQESQMADLTAQVEDLSGKLVFSYIALGIAAFAILMGIVAAVFALRKPKGQDHPDWASLATRDDVIALSNQQSTLRNQIGMLERKSQGKGQIDADELVKIQNELKQLQASLEAKTKGIQQAAAVSQTPPPPPPPKPICELELHYSPISPANSYMSKTSNGQYELWADMTVTTKPIWKGQMNSLMGWRESGLLYLYDPVINGVCLNMSRDSLPIGYYEIDEIIAPASVTESMANNYLLRQRGQVRMRKPK